MNALPGRFRYRTLFISDVHLGTRDCQAAFLLDFLKSVQCEKLYIVGDFIDGWRLRKNWYWPDSHEAVVQEILRMAHHGTEVVYVPGNHDEFLRVKSGGLFRNIKIRRRDVHVTADGRRFVVMHGDEFDGILRHAKWLSKLGDWAYQVALSTNRVYNVVRRRLGLRYWSLSAYLKLQVKKAVQFISHFEELVAAEARRRNADGVVCGHIHHAEIRQIDGIEYVNDGDWVESCTAVAEDYDGKMDVLRWTDIRHEDLYHIAVEGVARDGVSLPPEMVLARLNQIEKSEKALSKKQGSGKCASSSFQTLGSRKSMA